MLLYSTTTNLVTVTFLCNLSMAKKLIDKVDDDTFDRPRLAKSILKKTPSKRIPPSDIGKTVRGNRFHFFP